MLEDIKEVGGQNPNFNALIKKIELCVGASAYSQFPVLFLQMKPIRPRCAIFHFIAARILKKFPRVL